MDEDFTSESDRDLPEELVHVSPSSWGPVFFLKNPTQLDTKRWVHVVTVCCVISVFAYLLHQQIPSTAFGIRNELNVGTLSHCYVIAQVDFIHLDEEATWLARQQILNKLDPVYSISNTNTALQALQEQIASDYSPGTKNLSLRKLSFLARIALEELQRLLFTSCATAKFICIHVPCQYEVIPVMLSEAKTTLEIPEYIWSKVAKHIDLYAWDESAHYVLSFLHKHPWKFALNQKFAERMRNYAIHTVLVRYTQTKEGTLLLAKGELITPRHLRLVDAMNRTISTQTNQWGLSHLFGVICLVISLFGVFYGYIYKTEPRIFSSNRQLGLLFSLTCIYLVTAYGLHKLLIFCLPDSLRIILQATPLSLLIAWLSMGWYPLHVSFVVSTIANLILLIILPIHPVKFMIMNTVGLISVLCYGYRKDKKRDLVFIVLRTWAFTILTLLGISFIDQSYLYTHMWFEHSVFSLFLLSLIAGAIIIIGPFLEIAFSLVSDITLSEYLNSGHPLLQRMSLEAPGTYRHSLVVSCLAEQAALIIGANAMLCKVAGLYHDIGKIPFAQYFSENQQTVNIHHVLPPHESARIIKEHVEEGVALAEYYELPEILVAIIREHHGTGLVYYFYNKACEIYGVENVREEAFRYNGPKPSSKEAALIMISDCLEAASLSLEDVSFASVSELLDRIILDLIHDHQLDHCRISFENLHCLKNSLVRTLLASFHSRVKYPARKNLQKK